MRKLLITIITSAIMTVAAAPSAQAAWLSGWDQRLKMTIDSADIDANLSDFPILVYLSASSGRNSEDVSFVFDEVGANSKKIAVTKSDGMTECYVEIESWDNSSEKAWLWVKVSGTDSISATTDTDLYLYYDNDHADNTTYVGDVDSTPGQSVWDDNFVAVWHMSESSWSGIAGEAKDSKGTNNGTATGPNTTASGKIGRGGNWPGVDDYLDVTNVTASASFCVSFWGNLSTPPEAYSYLMDAQTGRWIIAMVSNNFQYYSGSAWTDYGSGIAYAGYLSAWHHYAWVFDSSASEARLYIDGGLAGTKTSASWNGIGGTVRVGWRYNGGSDSDFAGTLDEFRVSDEIRSAAWIKASCETSRDHLLDFGTKETPFTVIRNAVIRNAVIQ